MAGLLYLVAIIATQVIRCFSKNVFEHGSSRKAASLSAHCCLVKGSYSSLYLLMNMSYYCDACSKENSHNVPKQMQTRVPTKSG